MSSIDYTEFNRIARKLEDHHILFEKIWSMGRLRFSNRYPTAGVLFNKQGQCVEFFVNEDFWNSISFEKKCFVVSHECMHVALNHGKRTIALHKMSRNKKKNENKIINIAQDLVINHALVDYYGYDRKEVDAENRYAWLDTIFPPDFKVLKDQSFEYYYNKIKELASENPDALDGTETVDEHSFGDGEADSKDSDQNGNGSGQDQSKADEKSEGEFDGDSQKGDMQYTDDFSPVIDDLNDELTDAEKETIKDFIEKNQGSDKGSDSSDGKEEQSKGSVGGGTGGGRGTEAGGVWTFAKVDKTPRKKKWETVIKNWVRKSIKRHFFEQEQWVMPNRRMNMISTDMMIPSMYEIEDTRKEKNKINVWFFQDTSGSCSGYRDRFFKAAMSIPPEKFNMRLFCFDTKVYETTLESKKLYGFGGTAFDIIENYIQKKVSEGERYPDAVFVITDGYGNKVSPQYPKQWYWFLTPGGDNYCIHDDCKIYDLEKFE